MSQSTTIGMDAQVLIVGAGPTRLAPSPPPRLPGGCAVRVRQKDAPQVPPEMGRSHARTMRVHPRTGLCDGGRPAGGWRSGYVGGGEGGGWLGRRHVGKKASGEANIQQRRRALFYGEALYERPQTGKGRHYHVVAPEGSFLIVKDSPRHFTLHSV